MCATGCTMTTVCPLPESELCKGPVAISMSMSMSVSMSVVSASVSIYL